MQEFLPQNLHQNILKRSYEMNLELNFVNNVDYRLGLFEKAFSAFQNVINITENHAFAYYYAAKSSLKLGNSKTYNVMPQYIIYIISESILAKLHEQFDLDKALPILDDKLPRILKFHQFPVSGILTQISTPTQLCQLIFILI